MSSEIINYLPNIENKSYLELGINDNANFNKIKSKNKLSVDINGSAMFTGTTDDFFKNLDQKEKFDIIFIDANHDYDYVMRDFNNAVHHCNEWILIHDMIPPSKKYIQSKFCSDSYKLLKFFIEKTKFSVYPMIDNFGLTLIKMPALEITITDEYKNLDYKTFCSFINTVKLYSSEEIIDVLRNNNV